MSDAVVSSREFRIVDSTTWALTYRFFRHGWGMILGGLGITCVLPSALFLLISLLDGNVADALRKNLGPLQWVFFLFVVVGLPMLAQSEIINVRPLYTKPLSTRRIANTQLMLGMVTVLVLHWITVGYYRLLYGAEIPAITPIGFLIPGVLIASGLIAQLADFRWIRPPLVMAILCGLLYGSRSRFPGFNAEQLDAGWLTPTLGELAVLIPLACVAYIIVLRTAEQDRCGELGSWRVVEEACYRVLRWLGRCFAWVPSAPSVKWESPLRAQLSYEWWTRGLIAPILATVALTISMLGAWHNPREWCTGYLTGLPGILFFCMLMNGIVCGFTNSAKPIWEMERYRSTRPLSDRHLCHVTFANGLVGAASALAISGLFAVIVIGSAALGGADVIGLIRKATSTATREFGNGACSYTFILCSAIVAGWAAHGCMSTLMQTGRSWLSVSVWFGAFSLIPINVMLAKSLPEADHQRLVMFVGSGLAILAAAGTLLAYLGAKVKRLIELRHLLIGIVAWGVGAWFFTSPASSIGDSRWEATWIAIAAGSLVALPLAAGPLAVHWNRHR